MISKELGQKYPCTTQGESVIIEETEAQPGDILEFYVIPDREVATRDVIDIAFAIAKIKENYPDTVIHYIKVEPYKVTVQYSTSPMGGKKYTPWTIIILAFLAVLGIGIIAWRAEEIGNLLRGKPPVGSLSLSAKDADTGEALEVMVTVAGESYPTPAFIEDLTPGTYTVTWGDKAGYWPVSPTDLPVTADQTTPKSALYWPTYTTPPTTGWFIMDTSPTKGIVYVQGVEIGKAPQQLEVNIGKWTVSFGDVKGYEGPPAQTWDVNPGDVISATGIYTKPGLPLPAWAKGAAVVLAVGGTVFVGIKLLGRIRR